jgi:hypothetical protein
MGSVKNRIGDSQLTSECLRCYKPLEIERQVFSLTQPRAREFEYKIALRNMTINGKPCKLGRPLDGPWRSVSLGIHSHAAPASEAVFSVKWEEAEIDSKRIAFLLVSKIYEWFGIEHEEIPFAERVGNKLVISPEQLQALGISFALFHPCGVFNLCSATATSTPVR